MATKDKKKGSTIREKIADKMRPESGRVFSTVGSSMDEEMYKKAFTFSYDPHELTLKIMEFGKVLTGIPLYSYQEPFCYRIIYSVITFEGAEITGLWSRQSGKSEAMAFTIDTLMVIMPILAGIYPELKQFKDGIKIGLYAPQQLQVDTTYERALLRLKSGNAEMILGDIDAHMTSDRKLHLANGSYCQGQVASKTSKIESKTWDLLILEEAQDSDDFVVRKSIEPMTSATAGTFVKVGTTGTQKNNFWDSIQYNRVKQRTFRHDERMNLHWEFDYKKVIASKKEKYEETKELFHLHYQKDVMEKRAKWGEDSDAFKLGYALKWAMESGMFITDTQFDRMCNRRLSTVDVLNRKEKSSWHVVAGIDYGKDRASTIMTIARVWYTNDEATTEPPMKQVLAWVDMGEINYNMQHETILDAILQWNIQVIACDYTGVGKPPTERLMQACGDSVTIVPVIFSRPSKSDMWVALDADIKNNRLIVPAHEKVRKTDEFINFDMQMKGLRKSYEGSYMVCNKGEGIGDKDDYCDSLALMITAANHELPTEAEIYLDNPFIPGSGVPFINNIKNAHW